MYKKHIAEILKLRKILHTATTMKNTNKNIEKISAAN